MKSSSPKTSFRATYSIRRASRQSFSFVTSVPAQIVQASADRKGLSVEEFISTYEVEYEYGSEREDAVVRFIPKKRTTPSLSRSRQGDTHEAGQVMSEV